MAQLHHPFVHIVEEREPDDDNYVKQRIQSMPLKLVLPSLDVIKLIIYMLRKGIHALRQVTNIDLLLWSLMRSLRSISTPPSLLMLWLYCTLLWHLVIWTYPQNTTSRRTSTLIDSNNYKHVSLAS